VTAVAAVVRLLVAATLVTGRQAFQLARQRDEALVLQRKADDERRAARAATLEAEQSRDEAARQAGIAEAVSGFLEDVLASAEPYLARQDASIADAVRFAAERVDKRLRDGQMWAPMALAGATLLLRSQKELVCLRL
jgi:hypothetical protein